MHSVEQDLTQGKPSSVGISRVQELNEVSQDTTCDTSQLSLFQNVQLQGPCWPPASSCQIPGGTAPAQESQGSLRNEEEAILGLLPLPYL